MYTSTIPELSDYFFGPSFLLHSLAAWCVCFVAQYIISKKKKS